MILIPSRTERIGTCELCGGRDRRLRLLMIGDFAGMACEACCRQLQESLQRRFVGTGEETEPGE